MFEEVKEEFKKLEVSFFSREILNKDNVRVSITSYVLSTSIPTYR